MKRFLKVGFVLKEDIIKVSIKAEPQVFGHRLVEVKKSKEYNFLLIMHEHLFVFYKDLKG